VNTAVLRPGAGIREDLIRTEAELVKITRTCPRVEGGVKAFFVLCHGERADEGTVRIYDFHLNAVTIRRPDAELHAAGRDHWTPE
jgi:hypothetical protein